jgi:hypothetical protein
MSDDARCPNCGHEDREWRCRDCEEAVVPAPSSVREGGDGARMKGLHCETCGLVMQDQGGGRACFHGRPFECQEATVMKPVWLVVRPPFESREEAPDAAA